MEAGLVLAGRISAFEPADVAALASELGLIVRPFDESQIAPALDAYRRYGKGYNPASRLNLGDCIAYALATTLGVAPLFKGNDFAATDIARAI